MHAVVMRHQTRVVYGLIEDQPFADGVLVMRKTVSWSTLCMRIVAVHWLLYLTRNNQHREALFYDSAKGSARSVAS